MLNSRGSRGPGPIGIERPIIIWLAEARLRPGEADAVYAAICAELRKQIGLRVAKQLAQPLPTSRWFGRTGVVRHVVDWARAAS
jgi:hypothetical protein